MGRGVVWTGPGRRRAVAAAVGLAVCAGPLAVAPAASAATGGSTTSTVKEAKEVAKGFRGATVVGTLWGDTSADDAAASPSGRYDARQDSGSLYSITRAIGARDVWRQRDASGRAVTGRGVGVAVVDSGVAAVPGLDGAGKLVQGPDLSLEAGSTAALSTDSFGHGTHMAAIIGARDAVATDKAGTPKGDDASVQLGVAPDAQLTALKLATTDGSTDVSQVIAALDWVVEHKDDAAADIRVVNLSFGTDSVQPAELDPLATAAQNAWRAGLVVVVSGGNGGPEAAGLTDPAIDPYVLAVGASAPGQTLGWSAPTAADFTSRGTSARHVDLMAPGRSVVGLRSPGSFVDTYHPEGKVDGDTSGRLLRGSGTSQAAAVVSGAAALLVQADPTLTPDQVKAALVRTVDRTPSVSPLDGGAGQLDVAAAVKAVQTPGLRRVLLQGAEQTAPVATGLGTLEGARGTSHLADPVTGEVLSGERDVQGHTWDARAWATASAGQTSWSGGLWMGYRWTGDGWASDGASWQRARWADAGWSRARWADAGWDADAWARARWADSSWERARWADSGWERARWAGAGWS